MKKSFIALAVLAVASTATMAQSSVTLYGRIDTSVGNEKVTSNGVSTSTSQMFSGRLTSSRWGMMGTEDLGGGLKASFQLESGINTDTGAAGSTLFDRQSWVGLSGAFGAVKLGRTDTAYDAVRDLAISQSLWDSKFTPNEEAYKAGISEISNSGRAINQIRYDSPSMGGFTVGVSYGMDEKTANALEVTAVSARYKAGALDVGLAVQNEETFNTPSSKKDYTILAGAYNFGVVRLSAGYQRAETANNNKDNEYSFGVTMPLDKLELSFGYANSKAKSSTGATLQKGSGFGLGATYALSKRTRLYAGYRDVEVKTIASGNKAENRLYAVGVAHTF